MNERQQLIDWLNLFSLSIGEEFILASGQKSKVYVDVKKTAQHHQAYRLLARLLVEKVKEFAPFQSVAGVVLGGCHLASLVAMACPLDLDVVFVRKSAKDHGTQQLVERPLTNGREIVLLEDVITTGNSAIIAARLLEQEGFQVQGIVAVVDRRPVKTNYLKEFRFAALVEFEELSVEG